MNKFEIGDVVSHKSVMFPMVVVEVIDNEVQCEWFNMDYLSTNLRVTTLPIGSWVFRDFTLKKIDEQVAW